MNEGSSDKPMPSILMEGQVADRINLSASGSPVSDSSLDHLPTSSHSTAASELMLNQTTETDPVNTGNPLAKLTELVAGDVFANRCKLSLIQMRERVMCRYVFGDERIPGKPHIRFAMNKLSKQRVVLKFCSSRESFEKALEFNDVLSSRYVCKLASDKP